MTRLIFLLILLLMVNACSLLKRNDYPKSKKIHYSYNDNSGEYTFIKEIGNNNKKNITYVKNILTPQNGNENTPLEKTISVSSIGKLKLSNETISILRPKVSQYHIWLEGKSFFSQIKVDFKNRRLNSISLSPKGKTVKRNINIPKGNGVFCFYGQLLECISITGFIEKSMEQNAGKMNFYLIWDSYPYHKEQYANLPNNIISQAQFLFDGFDNKGNIRYLLKIEGQTIFYHINRKKELMKKNWVVQGISQEKI